MAQSLFSVGGLASGMDTQSIIDKLVQLESQPLTVLQQRQSACKTQVSLLGDLAARLADLRTAAGNLASGGVLGLQSTTSNSSFSAVPGTGAVAGSYDVQVNTLASAAKWRSGALGADDALKAGALTLTVDGKTYPLPDTSTEPPTERSIAVEAGESLQNIADAIRATGAPVSVTVLDDGTGKHLSITALATGYTASAALQVSFTPDDPEATGVDLGASAYHQDATNASFSIDDLTFSRTSNVVSDALPGTTLTLKSGGGAAETLSIANDPTATQQRLKTFVDSYNSAMTAVQNQLAVTKDTDRSTTLAGDSTIRGLQQALQSLGSSVVGGLGTVRSLADLGVKTGRDGTLTIDSTVLAAAIARNPAALNAVFADGASGISQLTSKLADAYTAPSSGLLVLRQTGLQDQIRSMDDRVTALQTRIDAYRDGLVAQFTAMEDVVGQLKAVGNFLTSQDNANSKK